RGYTLRLVRIARFKIGIHRKLPRGHDFRNVTEREVAADSPVGVRQSARECEPGAGRSQRLKSEMAQIPRRADVPWIRNYETADLVHSPKQGSASRDAAVLA